MDLEDRLSELIDDQNFSRIDQQFGRLNLFEALGAVRRELEHSNFLAFLLSPTRSHGLGAEPLRRMLRSFVEAIPKERRPIRSLDVVVGDLDDATVYRERDSIDLLIEVPSLRLVVLVENKVGAAASDGQLDRYATRVQQTHQGWRHLFVYLTPEGIDPEHESYVAFSYVQIARIIEELAEATASESEINLLLRHYVETLRRHVVQDENLKRLAVQIYERHKEALDFIFDCRPEPGNLLGTVRDLISKTPRLILDRQVNSIARFAPEIWTNIGPLNACSKELWTRSGRNVLFEVKSFKSEAYDFSDRILLSLIWAHLPLLSASTFSLPPAQILPCSLVQGHRLASRGRRCSAKNS